jgi:hypothetical protein
MYDRLLDDVAALLQQGAKALIGRRLLGINPDDQDPGRAKKFAEPVQRRLQIGEAPPSPIN